MKIGYLLLLAFIAYVALKYFKATVTIGKRVSNSQIAPPGVNTYCSIPVSSRPQQVLAFQIDNEDAASNPGYVPAFGPAENNPAFIGLTI